MQIRSRNQKFDKIFGKGVTEMENQIQHKKNTKLSQICSHLQTLNIMQKFMLIKVLFSGYLRDKTRRVWLKNIPQRVLSGMRDLSRFIFNFCGILPASGFFPAKCVILQCKKLLNKEEYTILQAIYKQTQSLARLFYFVITSLSSDNANLCSYAHQLLNGLRNDVPPAQQSEAKLKHHIVLLRCTAHVLDLCLKDYCKFYDIKIKLDAIAKLNNTHVSVAPTRWTSYQTAFDFLFPDQVSVPDYMRIHMQIVKLMSKTILEVEANEIDHSRWAYLICQLKDTLKTIQREDKYMTTHNKISNFFEQIDPVNEEARSQTETERFAALKYSDEDGEQFE
ncbi:Conserved_hypothetical protein [Hexamita inflata]|uniref:Uncharacterized protein n=1 Tax=Hexamita inflata TaxID=28002 RepID=A0AA86UPB9_9EUKA|nr:Conserved hypothetical protein [Hexamita inflata]